MGFDQQNLILYVFVREVWVQLAFRALALRPSRRTGRRRAHRRIGVQRGELPYRHARLSRRRLEIQAYLSYFLEYLDLVLLFLCLKVKLVSILFQSTCIQAGWPTDRLISIGVQTGVQKAKGCNRQA